MIRESLLIIVTVLIAVSQCQDTDRQSGNPIIDFFEAPIKALRARPGEAVAVFEPHVVRSNDTSSTIAWSPVQTLGNAANTVSNWIAQRVPFASTTSTTSTTPEPDVIVHVQTDDSDSKSKRKYNGRYPFGFRQYAAEEDDDDDDDDDEEESEQPASATSMRRYGYGYGGYRPPPHPPIRSSIILGPSNNQRQRIRIGLKNGYRKPNVNRYGPANSYHDYYDDDYYDDYYEEARPIRRIHKKKRKKTVKKHPQKDHAHSPAQSVQEIPVIARPINFSPLSPQQDQYQILYPSQTGNQYPVILPLQSIPLITPNQQAFPLLGNQANMLSLYAQQLTADRRPFNGINPMNPLNAMNAMNPLNSLNQMNPTYVPVPVQQLGLESSPIPQLQVVAQHTHTIEDNNGKQNKKKVSKPAADDEEEDRKPVRRPTVNKQQNDRNNRNKFRPNRKKPLRLDLGDLERPDDDSHMNDDYEGIPQPYITVGDEERDFQGRSEPLSAQYYIPQKYFPLLGSDSYLKVSSNGRFLLKTGRELDITKLDEDKKDDIKADIKDDNKDKPEKSESQVDSSTISPINEKSPEKPETVIVLPVNANTFADMDENKEMKTDKMEATEIISDPKEIPQTEDMPKIVETVLTEKVDPQEDNERKSDNIEALVEKIEEKIEETEPTKESPMKPEEEKIPLIHKVEVDDPVAESALDNSPVIDEDIDKESPIQLAALTETNTKTDNLDVLNSDGMKDNPAGHYIVKSEEVDSSRTVFGRANHQINRGNIRIYTL